MAESSPKRLKTLREKTYVSDTLLCTTQSRLLTTLKKKSFKNIVGNGENAGNQHFLLFPQCFLLYQRQKSSLELHLFRPLQLVSI